MNNPFFTLEIINYNIVKKVYMHLTTNIIKTCKIYYPTINNISHYYTLYNTYNCNYISKIQ